jgi:hypothetical protein
MWEAVQNNPGILIPLLAISIPIFAVVFGTVTGYLTAVRKAELETSLKLEMVQRGMSAEDIKTVIEATAPRGKKLCKSEVPAHE